MEEDNESGSIADFIDRTIVRCLMELEGCEKYHPATERTRARRGHNGSCYQEHRQNQALVPQSQAHGVRDQNQALDYQTQVQACQNWAADYQGQPQRHSNQAAGHPEQAAELLRNRGQDGGRFVPVLCIPESFVEKETVRDDGQLFHVNDSDSARSRSFTSSPSSEPEHLAVPGKDLNRRQLLAAAGFEETCPRQRTFHLMKQALPKTLTENASDRQYRNESGDASLSSGPVPSDLTSARNTANLRNGFADTSSSLHTSAVAEESDKADVDDVGKTACPVSSANLELDSDISNLQESSSYEESMSRELSDSSSDDDTDVPGKDGIVGDCTAGFNSRIGQISKTGTATRTRGRESSSSNGRSVGRPETGAGVGASAGSGNTGSAQGAWSVCPEGVGVTATSAVEDEDGEGVGEKSDLDDGDGPSSDSVVPALQGFQSEHKATDKVKKRLQKRYFEAEPQGSKVPGESTAVETFRYDGGKVSNWRIKKWKKRRLEPAEKAEEARSKSENTKRKHPIKQKKEKQKKTGKGSRLDDLEEPGFIQYGSDEEVDRLSQTEIAEAVDVTSATKYFELNLTDFGPYNITYSRNGRHLLLGGERGHVAAFDWQTKRLLFEMKPDITNSVRWLHQETMLAAAHPSGVCFYDNLGIEVHALTDLDNVLRMEFLPHHMLLATANTKGFLGYTDVSMGTRVAGICTGLGRLDVMTHNPANAIVYLGHAAGTVTLWSPTVKNPLVKILTHKSPVRALAIDSTGNYLATSGVDKRLKVYDLRTYKMVNKTTVPVGASSLAFSQRGLLAAALGNRVQVYKDCRGRAITPYLSHVTNGSLHSVEFCPFEDVLGAGHQRGFSSLIVPGSGDANYDALSVNPMANTKQRANAEVRLLLDKLQPEMIGLTNWVWDLARRSGAQKAPQSATKLGTKQKEELQRERSRQSFKDRKKQAARDQATDSDPLSRFRKSKS